MLTAYDGMAEAPADLTCLGVRTGPDGGAVRNIPIRVLSSGLSSVPIPSALFRVYPTNTVNPDGGCAPGVCEQAKADAGGMGDLNLADGRLVTTQVFADAPAGTLNTFTVNLPTALTDVLGSGTPALEFFGISGAIFNAALAAAAVNRQAGSVTFIGRGYDCAGRSLSGAELRVVGPAGPIAGGTTSTGVRYVYWGPGASLPSSSRTYTSTEGRFAGGNLPVSDSLRVELWAVTAPGAAPQRIACERIPAFGDSVVIVDLGPTRADGPPGC